MSGGLYLLLPLMETVCWDPPYLVHSFLALGRLPDLVFHAVLNFYTTMSYNSFPISLLGSSLSHRHVRFAQKTVSSPLLVWMCAFFFFKKKKSGRYGLLMGPLKPGDISTGTLHGPLWVPKATPRGGPRLSPVSAELQRVPGKGQHQKCPGSQIWVASCSPPQARGLTCLYVL